MTENITANTSEREDWKQRRDRQRADLLELLDRTTLGLAEDPEALARYLGTQARMDRYAVSNALLISAQLPEASRLRTFDEWSADGASIRKGSRSISILEPVNYTWQDGTEATAYNVKKVFDISQTTKADEAEERHPDDIKKIIAAMLDSCESEVELAEELPVQDAAAFYDRGRNRLFVLREGGTADEVCQHVAREIARMEVLRRDPDISEEDAEAVSAAAGRLVCGSYGVPADAISLSGAAGMFKGMPPRDIRSALKDICGLAAAVRERINTELYRDSQPKDRGEAR